MDYSKEKDTDATGDMILEFNAIDLASVLITFDSAAYWGFGDISQAVTPIPSQGIIVLDWQAFPPEIRSSGKKIVRIFAKRQAVGTLKTYINFLGRT